MSRGSGPSYPEFPRQVHHIGPLAFLFRLRAQFLRK